MTLIRRLHWSFSSCLSRSVAYPFVFRPIDLTCRPFSSSSFSFLKRIIMSTSGDWVPPEKVEDLNKHLSGNKFAGLNAPTAGPRETRELPVGTAPLQLYSLGTPNGQKVSIFLEELGVEYDAHTMNIGKGDQFTSGFVGVNPNSKIPALLDQQGPDGKPITLFESANIVLYLAEKYGNKFWFTDPRLKYEGLNWIFWQMAGQGPMTGQFGHFFVYAPADKHEARNYGASRYGMEVQRLCDVLDKHLAGKTYMVGETYSIVDMIVFPWWRALLVGYKHSSGRAAKDFLSVEKYTNAMAWFNRILERPAVQRGITVNDPPTGVAKPWLQKKD